MGNSHKKPDPNPHLPGDCPTVFECQWKRFQVSKRTVQDAYEQDPMTFHVLVCFLIFIFAVGIGVTYYRMRRIEKNVRLLKQGGAHHFKEEKGHVVAFSDNV